MASPNLTVFIHSEVNGSMSINIHLPSFLPYRPTLEQILLHLLRYFGFCYWPTVTMTYSEEEPYNVHLQHLKRMRHNINTTPRKSKQYKPPWNPFPNEYDFPTSAELLLMVINQDKNDTYYYMDKWHLKDLKRRIAQHKADRDARLPTATPWKPLKPSKLCLVESVSDDGFVSRVCWPPS